MKASEKRVELQKYIDTADDATLNYLREAIVQYQLRKEERAPFNPNDSKPMTLQVYHQLVFAGEEDLRNGEFYTNEEANAIMDSWDGEDQ